MLLVEVSTCHLHALTHASVYYNNISSRTRVI